MPLLALCPLFLGACSGQSAKPPPALALAMDGPPLVIAGEYSGRSLTGTMDRTCMAGYGTLSLYAVDTEEEFACAADVDGPPSEKGRIRGLLRCTNGENLLFSLRNTGPDQGVGIGREAEGGELLLLFYHPSAAEAERRFPAVKEDFDRARAQQ